jgi:hypothetical protein
MKIGRTAKFSFSNEEIEMVGKLRSFLEDMDDRDYEDLKEAADFGGELFDSLDNLYNFMCENPE